MRTQRLMLLAILGLLGPGLPRSFGAEGPANAGAPSADLGNGRCNTPPCTCDPYGRLTCECKDATEELILTAEGERGLSRHTSRIVVSDCASVVLASHSLGQMDGLSAVELVNVGNLSLARHSFKLSGKAVGVRLSLRNVSLDALPSNVFHGDVDSIDLESAHIGKLEAFAFANLVNTNRITLNNCQIEEVEVFAFKKFEVRFLHVIGGSFGRDEVPSRAINDVEVHDKFMLDGVRMGLVRSSAFILKRPKTVALLNCAIDSLESEAFDIGARGTVIIKNNSLGNLGFGVFLSIRADPEARPSSSGSGGLYSLMFKANNITSFEAGSLLFDRSSFRAELSNVLINQACDCELIGLWKGQLLNYTSPRLGSSTTVVLPEPGPPEDPESFLCLDEPELGSSTSFTEYESRHCVLSGGVLLLILGLCGLLLLLLLAGCLVVYFCRSRRRDARKRWISVPTSAPDVLGSKPTKNGLAREGGPPASAGTGAPGGPVDSRITMVVPDGRLYRETEFHVIVEKAEPLTTEL